MENIKPEELWFNTPDSHTLCRAGGNGPDHPSQLYAIRKYVKSGMSFLDYGCGSATTLEALIKDGWNILPQNMAETGNKYLHYQGLDIIPKNIEWCRKNFPQGSWKINKLIHQIDEASSSFDVVYSRHVVDHMESFEKALDEHCRVAKKFVIIILWVPLATGEEHEIKNIIDQGKTYKNEYTNSYSKSKVIKALHEKIHQGWKLLEMTEDVGADVKGHDTVICLERKY